MPSQRVGKTEAPRITEEVIVGYTVSKQIVESCFTEIYSLYSWSTLMSLKSRRYKQDASPNVLNKNVAGTLYTHQIQFEGNVELTQHTKTKCNNYSIVD